MKTQNWYPAAALSALLLGCGGSTDDGKGGVGSTGGSTSIDGGTPTNTGGQPATFYGMLVTGGTKAGVGGGASIDGGAPAFTGGQPAVYYGIMQATGGLRGTGGMGVTLYGPRFDKPSSSSVSTGGNRAREDANAEGGAIDGSASSAVDSDRSL